MREERGIYLLLGFILPTGVKNFHPLAEFFWNNKSSRVVRDLWERRVGEEDSRRERSDASADVHGPLKEVRILVTLFPSSPH